MQLHQYINQIIGCHEISEKIAAARCLISFIHEPLAMDVLCEVAVTTTSQKFRKVLLEVLRNRAEEAQKRFSDAVLWSNSSFVRRWALVNLSLMGCSDAKNAVISGLYDPNASVREAAVRNIGLYTDEEVRMVFDHYFKTQGEKRKRFNSIEYGNATSYGSCDESIM